MANRHVIENAVFDISFGSEEEAFEQQSALDEFVNRRLMALVERVFDELSASGVVSRIEELELDLGQVPYNGYQAELEVRLEERLRAALRSRIPSAASRPGENGSEKADYGMRRETADLQQVQYFLTHGNLPWNSVLDAGLTFDDLVETVVRSNGPELAEFLRRSVGDRTVAQRIASQFSDDILAEIAALLAPSLSGTLPGVLDHLIRIWRENNRGAAPTSGARRLIWELIIGELLSAGPTRLTRDDLISRAVQKITGPEGAQGAVIAGAPGPSADGQGDASSHLSVNGDGDAAGGVVSGEDSPSGGLSETPSRQPSNEIESMRRLLADALLSGDAQALERIWPVLMREQPSLLAEAARHYMRSARTRKNIVGALPEFMLGDILRLLSPGATGTVADVLHESAALVESLLMASGQALPGGDDIGNLVWEHAFAYVLAQDESAGFDLGVYLESLIQRAAEEHEVAEYSRLLDGLAESLEASDRNGVPPSPFIQAVRGLAQQAADRQIAAEDSQEPALEVLRSYDLYGLLTERLREAEDPRDDIEATVSLTEIIDELTRLYPWQIQKLLREFQSGALSAADAAAALHPEDLGRLVQAMLSVAERVEDSSRSDLMGAVEAYAAQVMDLRRYYQRVLDYLAQGKLVDFATIAEADRSPDEPAPAPDMAEETEEPPSQAEGSRIIARLKSLAAAPDDGEDQQAVSLAELINDLAQSHPDGLQNLIRELHTGVLSASDAAASLDVPELASLARVFLTASSASTEGEPLGLLQAIEAYESRTADPQWYYQQILEHAIEDRPIDLEQIAASARPLDGPTRPSTADQLPREGDSRSRDLVRAYDLYQRLRYRLARPPAQGAEASDVGGESVISLVDELVRSHPQQLRELFREFQTGGITAAQAAAGLSTEELRRLVMAFVTVNDRPGSGVPGEFVQAIETHADSVTDTHWYYQQVLDHLVQDRPIDLEQISASARPLEGSTEPGSADQLPADGDSRSRDLVRAYDLYQRLRDRLTQPLPQGVEASIVGSESVIGLIDELARGHPQQLRQLFRDFQSGEVALTDASARFSTEELAHLTQAFLTVNRRPGGYGPPDLPDSIQAFAQRAEDAHRFYSQLLAHIVQDRVIKLEAIAAGETAPPDAAEIEPADGPQILASGPRREAGAMAESDAVQALADYLRGGAALAGDEAARFVRSIEALLSAQSRPLRRLLEGELDSREAASRLIGLLPDRLLTRALYLVRPSEHHRIQRTGDILADALHARELGLTADRVRDLKWQFIFQYVFERGFAFRENVFVRDFVDFVSGQAGLPGVEELRGILGRQLILNILPSTRQLQLQIFWAVTRDVRQADDPGVRDGPATTAAEAADSEPSRRDGELRTESDEERPPSDIYIANAGLVLAAPYLQRLFEMLELTDGPAFKNNNAAERAVHLLQFMADASTGSPEHLLALNKILCGVRLGLPIVREIDITDREKEAVEGLIQGMVQNWRALGNTSVAGFRESFLQREGRLQLNNNAWNLLVEPRPFDMLLDQIPWSFSTIRLPWMERVIYVDWR